MPEEKIGAAMGAEWALNNQTCIYMNGWFLSPEQVWLFTENNLSLLTKGERVSPEH